MFYGFACTIVAGLCIARAYEIYLAPRLRARAQQRAWGKYITSLTQEQYEAMYGDPTEDDEHFCDECK